MSDLGSSPRILSKQTAEHRVEIKAETETYNNDDKGRPVHSLQRRPRPRGRDKKVMKLIIWEQSQRKNAKGLKIVLGNC